MLANQINEILKWEAESKWKIEIKSKSEPQMAKATTIFDSQQIKVVRTNAVACNMRTRAANLLHLWHLFSCQRNENTKNNNKKTPKTPIDNQRSTINALSAAVAAMAQWQTCKRKVNSSHNNYNNNNTAYKNKQTEATVSLIAAKGSWVTATVA